MITVEMVRDKGFEFVEGDWVLPQYLHGKSCSFEVDSITARWLKKGSHWGGTEVEKFAWRDNKGEMPCDGDLLVEVELANGNSGNVIADSVAWKLDFGESNINKWRPSLKNWESEMNLDKIETQEEKEAFDIIAQDNEKLHNHEIGKDSEIHNGSEWKRGDECVYKNNGAVVIGWHPSHPVLIIDSDEFGLESCSECELSKPETPEQKAKRTESAYDLYGTMCDYDEFAMLTYSQFKESDYLVGWLKIVDKTNYRKQDV